MRPPCFGASRAAAVPRGPPCAKAAAAVVVAVAVAVAVVVVVGMNVAGTASIAGIVGFATCVFVRVAWAAVVAVLFVVAGGRPHVPSAGRTLKAGFDGDVLRGVHGPTPEPYPSPFVWQADGSHVSTGRPQATFTAALRRDFPWCFLRRCRGHSTFPPRVPTATKRLQRSVVVKPVRIRVQVFVNIYNVAVAPVCVTPFCFLSMRVAMPLPGAFRFFIHFFHRHRLRVVTAAVSVLPAPAVAFAPLSR